MGPELLRVKDLARRSNEFTLKDFKDALKVFDRIYEKWKYGIVITRGGAGSELVPSSFRTKPNSILTSSAGDENCSIDDTGAMTTVNELREHAIYKVRDEIADVDILPIILPENPRYNFTIYADASFAVGPMMQSVSGYVVHLNGAPPLWGH
jgi:hypothetical protein